MLKGGIQTFGGVAEYWSRFYPPLALTLCCARDEHLIFWGEPLCSPISLYCNPHSSSSSSSGAACTRQYPEAKKAAKKEPGVIFLGTNHLFLRTNHLFWCIRSVYQSQAPGHSLLPTFQTPELPDPTWEQNLLSPYMLEQTVLCGVFFLFPSIFCPEVALVITQGWARGLPSTWQRSLRLVLLMPCSPH